MTTNNNNLSVRTYTPEFKKLLSAVFGVKTAFINALAPLQLEDGITHSKKAFSVKTNATPVVVGDYNKATNVALGDLSAGSSRFGNITEVIYTDIDVPYDYDYAIHEGLDRHTVNADLDSAVADRLALQSEALTRKANGRIGKFLSDVATKTLTLSANDKAAVHKMFKDAAKYLVDLEVTAPVTVYVRPEIYALYQELTNTVNSSGFATDFSVLQTPSTYFQSTDMAYFVPDGVVIPFIGIQTARTIEAINFDGVLLQGTVKGGTFMLDDNKKAIIKVTGIPGL